MPLVMKLKASLASVSAIRDPSRGPPTRNGRVAPAAASSLVWLRAGGYSERRKAIRSERSCREKPMWNRLS
jgi:hypothetical protein